MYLNNETRSKVTPLNLRLMLHSNVSIVIKESIGIYYRSGRYASRSLQSQQLCLKKMWRTLKNIDQPAVCYNWGVGPDGKFDLGLCFNLYHRMSDFLTVCTRVLDWLELYSMFELIYVHI